MDFHTNSQTGVRSKDQLINTTQCRCRWRNLCRAWLSQFSQRVERKVIADNRHGHQRCCQQINGNRLVSVTRHNITTSFAAVEILCRTGACVIHDRQRSRHIRQCKTFGVSSVCNPDSRTFAQRGEQRLHFSFVQCEAEVVGGRARNGGQSCAISIQNLQRRSVHDSRRRHGDSHRHPSIVSRSFAVFRQCVIAHACLIKERCRSSVQNGASVDASRQCGSSDQTILNSGKNARRHNIGHQTISTDRKFNNTATVRINQRCVGQFKGPWLYRRRRVHDQRTKDEWQAHIALINTICERCRGDHTGHAIRRYQRNSLFGRIKGRHEEGCSAIGQANNFTVCDLRQPVTNNRTCISNFDFLSSQTTDFNRFGASNVYSRGN